MAAADLGDLAAFVAVLKAGGFRLAARAGGPSASALSEAVQRLEARLGVRLINRTTRTVVATAAGQRLYARLVPALAELDDALDVVNEFRDSPRGTLRLNVPTSAARLVLPAIVPPFLAAYPEIVLDLAVDEDFVDVLAEGCDAGIRYDERLESDMIAVPIGPRTQRFAAAASPAYLARRGTPAHPHDLAAHACLRSYFRSGAPFAWEFEADGRPLRVEPEGPLLVQAGGGTEVMVDAAVAGVGVVFLFEDWLAPSFAAGTLVPILQPYWPRFSGPFLYYPGRRRVPAPLRAFVDWIKR